MGQLGRGSEKVALDRPRLTLKEGQDRRGGPGQGHGSLLSEKNLGWVLGDMAV